MPLRTEETPSRWGAIVKTLGNKKAMDVAFLKHQWDMESEAQQLASGDRQDDRRQKNAMELLNRREELDNTPDNQARNYAMKYVVNQGLDLESEEGQTAFQKVYQMFLHQFTGGKQGAMAAAAGEPQPQEPTGPSPVAAWDPRRMLPGFAHYSDKQAATTPMSSAKEKTATNPKTGEKLVLRNGKWQKM
jgi:hypothetical protein